MLFFNFLVVAALAISLLLLIFAAAQFFNVIVRGFPPFLPTKDKIITLASADLQLNNQDVVYELGCGRAKFLRNLAQKFPAAEYIGIEYSFFPYLLSKLQLLISREPVKIRKANFFKVDLSRATLLYFYLLPETMERLSLKIRQDCRPGTRVISYQFSVPGLELEKMVINKRDRLYFYRV
jgi:hypothetical protein